VVERYCCSELMPSGSQRWEGSIILSQFCDVLKHSMCSPQLWSVDPSNSCWEHCSSALSHIYREKQCRLKRDQVTVPGGYICTKAKAKTGGWSLTKFSSCFAILAKTPKRTAWLGRFFVLVDFEILEWMATFERYWICSFLRSTGFILFLSRNDYL